MFSIISICSEFSLSCLGLCKSGLDHLENNGNISKDKKLKKSSGTYYENFCPIIYAKDINIWLDKIIKIVYHTAHLFSF